MLRAPVDRIPLPRETRFTYSINFSRWWGGAVPEVGGRQTSAPPRTSQALLPERIDTYFEPFLRWRGGVLSARPPRRKVPACRPRRRELRSWSPCYSGNSATTSTGVIWARSEKVSQRQRAVLPRCGGRDPVEGFFDGAGGAPHLPESMRLQRPLSCEQQWSIQRAVRPLPAFRSSATWIVAAGRLRRALQRRRRIVCGDFVEHPEKESAPATSCTSMPPYVPLSATSSFTAYAKRHFGADDQARLADALRGLGGAEGAGRCCRTRIVRRRASSIAASTTSIASRPAAPSTPSVTAEVPSTKFWSAASTTRLRSLSPVVRLNAGEWDRWTAAAQCGPVDGVTP